MEETATQILYAITAAVLAVAVLRLFAFVIIKRKNKQEEKQ